MIDRLNRFFATLPSTNFRIFITLFITVLTALRYISSGLGITAQGLHVDAWTPTGEWLLFLAGMAGIDVAQFATKRTTTKDPPRPDAEEVAALRETSQ